MSSLGFPVPTTEDILSFFFFLINFSLILTLLIKAAIFKFSRKKISNINVNYLTSGYATLILIALLTILMLNGGPIEDFILNLPLIIIYDVIVGVIALVVIFILLKILDFIF